MDERTAHGGRNGWIVEAGGRRARLAVYRPLPAVLLLLSAVGFAGYVYALLVAGSPPWWIHLFVLGGVAVMALVARNGLRADTTVSFEDGRFVCASTVFGMGEDVSLPLASLRGFEARFPMGPRNPMPYVIVAITADGEIELPIPVAESAPVFGRRLAEVLAAELSSMLAEAAPPASLTGASPMIAFPRPAPLSRHGSDL